ncbi:MAG TPA: (2Fe-2S) ferredoxin domain-containing protein [Firmicutes bacterium]|nr:(2Fe-2S) ferredoxin domain-containing protein [Bacillota bacterium]
MACSRSRGERERSRILRLVASHNPGASRRILRSVDDLRDLRKKLRDSGRLEGRIPGAPGRAGTRITVGFGVCGLMASADKIYDAIVDELSSRRITDVTVKKSGCLGFCGAEPTVVVDRPGSPATAYARVSPSGARRIVVQHVINGHVVREFLACRSGWN